MIFQFPTLLWALLILPVVWWLLRIVPPRARVQVFPPVAVLNTLQSHRHETAQPSLWVLLLRCAALCFLIIGFANPFLVRNTSPLAQGPVLLLIDNDMFSADHWSERLATARNIVAQAAQAHDPVILILTAPLPFGERQTEHPIPQPAATVQAMLTTLHPEPWFSDRITTTRVLKTLAQTQKTPAAIFYITDGITPPHHDADETAFRNALHALGSVQDIRFPSQTLFAITAPPPLTKKSETKGFEANTPHTEILARLLALPTDQPRHVSIGAYTQDGNLLAVIPVSLPAHATHADLITDLPLELCNRIASLRIQGVMSAPATFLRDRRQMLHPVGLLSTASGNTPFLGRDFYLRRALAPLSFLHEGSASQLLAQPLSVLIAPDGSLLGEKTRDAVRAWVEKGGTLIRFAGPLLISHDNENDDETSPSSSMISGMISKNLLPVTLLTGTRQLNGAMTWDTPQKLAPFAQNSPFYGLTIPQDVTISQQVLANPSLNFSKHVWARLADGTPLVTHAPLGKGEIILFHTSSTADWSNLPLSGLFISMLQRLIDQANGVHIPTATAFLAPVFTLNGEGILETPSPSARGIKSADFAHILVSVEHPPGFYGHTNTQRALNAMNTLDTLKPEALFGVQTDPTGQHANQPLGRLCLLIALSLLFLESFIVPLIRAGITFSKRTQKTAFILFLWSLGGLGTVLSAPPSAHAQGWAEPYTPPNVPQAVVPPTSLTSTDNSTTENVGLPTTVPQAALETRLAYIITGHQDIDTVSQQGLQGLSEFVNAKTSVVLGPPVGVHPGTDDLNYYPLIYYPVTSQTPLSSAAVDALNQFMAHGGVLLVDTQEGTNDNDDNGTSHILRSALAGLRLPPLMTITDHNLLAHTFYLLHGFPGRYAGLPVWISRVKEAENDDISPIIIGSADWAHAWAVDSNGNTPYAVIPGGAEQRQQAYRFGLNVVLYALTGSYKADQVHIPSLLKRLNNNP